MMLFLFFAWLLLLVLLLVQLFILCLSIAATIFALRKAPNSILDFFRLWLRFWSDLWYNIFRKEKAEKK